MSWHLNDARRNGATHRSKHQDELEIHGCLGRAFALPKTFSFLFDIIKSADPLRAVECVIVHNIQKPGNLKIWQHLEIWKFANMKTSKSVFWGKLTNIENGNLEIRIPGHMTNLKVYNIWKTDNQKNRNCLFEELNTENRYAAIIKNLKIATND